VLVDSGRKEEPGPSEKRRSRTQNGRDKKRGRLEGKGGKDEMGMGMLKWISRHYDNFAGARKLKCTIPYGTYSTVLLSAGTTWCSVGPFSITMESGSQGTKNQSAVGGENGKTLEKRDTMYKWIRMEPDEEK
jgi:hypothetical protein